jgi:AraC-like DNA-binding protein
MEFVREVRIREGGKLLLTTDLSVDGIADRVGFASRSHFSRAFRDYFSQTPTEFRST